MKQSYFRRLTSSIIACGLLFSVIGTPATALAQTPSTADQLQTLATSLSSVGALIAASPQLTDADRLLLLTQLVTISKKIIEIRQSSYLPAYTAYLNPALDSDAGKETAEAAGLTRVRVAFNPTTNQAVTEIFYKTTVQTATHTFTELATAPNFEQKMVNLRSLLSAKISADTNIKQSDIRQLMHVSGRDPLRDSPIAQNSATANYLSNKFGQHSIVNKVLIRPGNGVGSISILSDQGESLVLTLANEVDPNSFFFRPNKYSYSYEFFIPTPYDAVASLLDPTAGPIPVISQVTNNVTESDIKKYILSLFNDVPFTSKISNFEGKLLSFLIQNPTTYKTSSGVGTDSGVDCYYASDEVVVNEFIDYLVGGIAVQHEDLATIKQYSAPIEGDPDSFFSGSCSSRSRMF